MSDSPAHAGCLVFLIDCSESMRRRLDDRASSSWGDMLAKVISSKEGLGQLVELDPSQSVDVAVLVYHTDRSGEPHLSLAMASNGFVESVDRDVPVDNLGSSTVVSSPDVVAQPLPRGGGSPACHALAVCRDLLSSWVQRHEGARPPIVVHVTDGRVGDGSPAAAAQSLCELRTDIGRLFLLTAVCDADAPSDQCLPSRTCEFPGDPSAPYAQWRSASSCAADYSGDAWNPFLSIAATELYPSVADSSAVIFCRTEDDVGMVVGLTLTVALGLG